MIRIVFTVLYALTLPPAAAWGWELIFRQKLFLASWASSAAFGTGYGLFRPDWLWLAGSGASLAVVLAIWWRRRKKRRRALAMLGAKSKALIAAMVGRMRRERKPSRVLRPHPVPS